MYLGILLCMYNVGGLPLPQTRSRDASLPYLSNRWHVRCSDAKEILSKLPNRELGDTYIYLTKV